MSICCAIRRKLAIARSIWILKATEQLFGKGGCEPKIWTSNWPQLVDGMVWSAVALWAASAAALDRAEEARAAVEYCLAQRPDLRVGSVAGIHVSIRAG